MQLHVECGRMCRISYEQASEPVSVEVCLDIALGRHLTLQVHSRDAHLDSRSDGEPGRLVASGLRRYSQLGAFAPRHSLRLGRWPSRPCIGLKYSGCRGFTTAPSKATCD